MKRLKELVSELGVKILDIGTGNGSFISTISNLTDRYEEMVGIDNNDKAINLAKKNFKDNRIRFVKMDALNMDFEDDTFDIVCLSNSLHHLSDIRETIKEMQRVLKPGGFLLFNEMYSDVKDDKQLTHVELHHYWAEIDRLNGVVHNETMKRKEILDTLEDNSDLKVDESWDLTYEAEHVITKETLEWLIDTIDKSLDRVNEDKDDYFKIKADVLKDRLKKVGFKPAQQLVVIMK